MALSRTDFENDARALVKALDGLQRQWQQEEFPTNVPIMWELVENETNGLYLQVLKQDPPTSRMNTKIGKTTIREDLGGSEHTGEKKDDWDLQNMEDDAIVADPQLSLQNEPGDSNGNNAGKEPRVLWFFSVVYSDTYDAPVLYFHAQIDEGSPLTRQDVLRQLPDPGIEDLWEFISQEEHPATGTPSFFLHPCQTSQRLQLVLSTSSSSSSSRQNVLWTWMSMILPAVGHPIPPSLFAAVQRRISQNTQNDIL